MDTAPSLLKKIKIQPVNLKIYLTYQAIHRFGQQLIWPAEMGVMSRLPIGVFTGIHPDWEMCEHMGESLLLLFSCQIVSNSLWPHGLQHTRFPCPSASSGVCPSPCILNQWEDPEIYQIQALNQANQNDWPKEILSHVRELNYHKGATLWVCLCVYPQVVVVVV